MQTRLLRRDALRSPLISVFVVLSISWLGATPARLSAG